MLIYTVSDDACQWNGHDVVISIGGIFFIERFVCCMTKKSWAFSDLVAAISAALHETFVRSKYAKSVSQFLLYWMRIICCIYKDFVRQLKAFLPSFYHSCACEMSPGWGYLIIWMDPSVGYLNGILARVGGIWTIIFKKVKCPEVPEGGCWSFDLTDTLRQTCTTWPSFPLIFRLLFIAPTQI